MNRLKAWLNAARLRTLPLSVSGIVVGATLASYFGHSNQLIFWLAILTTIGFQVTSNLANDYGDGIKGTDNENRIGPKRALQSGLLTKDSLKKGILISIIIDLSLVLALLYVSFSTNEIIWGLLFLLLGVLSLWAAVRYTVGENAYGYHGLGDVFVFLFFGLLAVIGSMFLFVKTVFWVSLLPAITVGLLSVAVLNLNNLRDHASDRNSGKNTMIVKMGFKKGKIYHFAILLLAFISWSFFVMVTATEWKHWLSFLAFVPIVVHLVKVWRNESPALMDPELKKVSLSTFFMALLFYFSYYNFFIHKILT